MNSRNRALAEAKWDPYYNWTADRLRLRTKDWRYPRRRPQVWTQRQLAVFDEIIAAAKPIRVRLIQPSMEVT